MPILTNISTLATCRAEGAQSEIHTIPDAALVWEGPDIEWVGPGSEVPRAHSDLEKVDAGGRLVIPGLVDCHTHLAFGGWRSDEYELRLQGRGYLEIARSGGGILSTVRATRAAGKGELVSRCLGFLAEIGRLGITTIECKSGYGLDFASELKLLEVYRRINRVQPLRIVPTFLGAHVVAPEFRENRADYVKLLIDEMIPAIEDRNLADFCDVFIEETAFTASEARDILKTGQAHGLRSKLHVDQLSSCGGAELAAELNAVSADHLECISDAGIQAMAGSDVVAVNLPLASLYLDQKPMPARRLIDAGVRLAVATDFNPGSAPSYNLPLAMMLACNQQRLTPAEVLKGATIFAAAALCREERIGSLEPGKSADFAIIDSPDVNHWMYHFRPNACLRTFVRGSSLDAAHSGRNHP